VVFYTGSVHGTLEPCGCTSDPLGDIARLFGLVRRAVKAGEPVLVVDAGNLTYPPGEIGARKREALDLKAAFLARELEALPFGGAALGEADLARGPEKVAPRRLASNVVGASFAAPGVVRTVGGVKVGLFGLPDPEVARRAGLRAEDPAAVATREGARLRREGAELVIALPALDRARARQVARGGGADFVIVGSGVGEGLGRADPVEGAFVIAPGAELERVGRLEIVLRGPATGGAAARAALVDAGGPEARRLEREELERSLAGLESELGRWERDPTADRAFVAQKRAQRDAQRARLAALSSSDFKPPDAGSYFVNRLIPLRRALPRDERLAAAMRRLDKAMGAASLRTARPPPPGEPGRATFVGDRSCATCHEPEMAFWRRTVHAKAWRTLVDGGKTLDEECVSCHVTGYGEVGGSSLGHVANLTNVQCETCHGPGSLHVAAEGLEDPPAVRLETPERTCLACHNEKHSDTFQYAAYMRDILGPGHGATARKKLGDGLTGRELRRAAIAKARAAGAALAKEM
jgi:hypothetical protein